MMYHVLPGDAQVEAFRASGIEGEVLVCREALIYGPIDAEDLDSFWRERAQFIVSEYGEDEISYHENVADQLSRLQDLGPDDEVALWFEYELFCSVNMWFCLSLLENTGAAVYRVEPLGRDVEDRWDGFGNFSGEEMKAAFELRTRLNDEQVALGSSLWRAYRSKEHAVLRDLSAKCDADCFPYLKEVVAAAAEEDIHPQEVVKEIVLGIGSKELKDVFPEFKRRAGVYGYGDQQVQQLIDGLRPS